MHPDLAKHNWRGLEALCVLVTSVRQLPSAEGIDIDQKDPVKGPNIERDSSKHGDGHLYFLAVLALLQERSIWNIRA